MRTADISKIQNTRVNLKESFEAFKKQRAEEIGTKQNGATDAVTGQTENQVNQSGIEESTVTTDESTVQSELSLNEPPDEIEKTAPTDEWANAIPETTLLGWWQEFIETQSVRTASLMKTLRPRQEGDKVIVTVPPKKDEMLEAVKFPFNRFISEVSDGKLQSMVIEIGEIEETERRPYTDKEKLDYLMKRHPELDDIIKKLGLRLP